MLKHLERSPDGFDPVVVLRGSGGGDELREAGRIDAASGELAERGARCRSGVVLATLRDVATQLISGQRNGGTECLDSPGEAIQRCTGAYVATVDGLG